MRLLQLTPDSLHDVFKTTESTESGMDFAIVTGDSDVIIINGDAITLNGLFVVRGNGRAVPIEKYDDIYTLVDMYEGQPRPNDLIEITLRNIHKASLPPRYVPGPGAHQLLGLITLTRDTQFFRFSSAQIDPRFRAPDTILIDTYLTTQNDRRLSNTGFGAVGRYALPMPIPASYVHDYIIPANIQLQVGTVAPLFEQAGGGVEVKTISAVSGVVRNAMT